MAHAAPPRTRSYSAKNPNSAIPASRSEMHVWLLFPLFAAVATSLYNRPDKPIVLEQSGGFNIGGKIIENPDDPGQTLTCDHGYTEYFIPWEARETSLVMWHSSSSQVWQNRWDGGEGFKDKFLRRGYPVYIWDGPRVGRAGWSCEAFSYEPSYRDSDNFVAWNFGPEPGVWWDNAQFPTKDRDYRLQQANGARYIEFDTMESVQIQSDAAALSADYGMNGDIVYLTNSAAGLRAMLTTVKSNYTNIRGIVAYESVGLVFPERSGVEQGTGGFGPVVVPDEEFEKLANLDEIQLVFGDHRAEDFPGIQEARQMVELINEDGGNAKVVMLGDDEGLEGSSHIPFADMDNEQVAGLLDDFLERNGLDGY